MCVCSNGAALQLAVLLAARGAAPEARQAALGVPRLTEHQENQPLFFWFDKALTVTFHCEDDVNILSCGCGNEFYCRVGIQSNNSATRYSGDRINCKVNSKAFTLRFISGEGFKAETHKVQ